MESDQQAVPISYLNLYTRTERGSWPLWVRVQWIGFRKTLKDLDEVIDSQLEHGVSRRDLAQRRTRARLLKAALLRPGGIAIHFERPFPIGGPGIECRDVRELASLVGVNMDSTNRRGTLYLGQIMGNYASILRDSQPPDDVMTNRLLATSASARARARGLRVTVPIGGANDAREECQIPYRFVENTTTNWFTAEAFAALFHFHLSGAKHALAHYFGYELAWHTLQQGGKWDSSGNRWQSIPELILDERNLDGSAVWMSSDRIWRQSSTGSGSREWTGYDGTQPGRAAWIQPDYPDEQ